MNDSCRPFREQLARALSESDVFASLQRLDLEQHPALCADCRMWLESERGLEELLAAVPASRPDRGLARRVLQHLSQAESASNRSLDDLLDLDEVHVPDGLSARVLGGLASQRAPQSALPAARAGSRSAARPAAWRSSGVWRMAAAAALVLGALAWWALRERSAPGEIAAPVVAQLDEPPQELIAELELLEDWDLLVDASFEELMGSLDSSDTLWLEMDTGLDGGSAESGGPEFLEGSGEERSATGDAEVSHG